MHAGFLNCVLTFLCAVAYACHAVKFSVQYQQCTRNPSTTIFCFMQLHNFAWMVALFLSFLVRTLWNKKNDPKSNVQFKHHKEAHHHKEACCLLVYVACIYMFDSDDNHSVSVRKPDADESGSLSLILHILDVHATPQKCKD